jgi:hypothetical protein
MGRSREIFPNKRSSRPAVSIGVKVVRLFSNPLRLAGRQKPSANKTKMIGRHQTIKIFLNFIIWLLI